MKAKELSGRMRDPLGDVNMRTFDVPDGLYSLAARLENAGFEAYAVGGCVRDMIMGRKPWDFDLTTNADIDSLQEIFPEARVLSEKYSVVRVKAADKPEKAADIASYRREGAYENGRPIEIFFVDEIEEDLPRRDFTINALALRPVCFAETVRKAAERRAGEGAGEPGSENAERRAGEPSSTDGGAQLIDMFGGLEDIRRKRIRTIGNADKRFAEDPLRMLRAVRLAAQLDFEIDEEVQRAMRSNSRLLAMASGEKSGSELAKMLNTEHAGKGLAMLLECGGAHLVLGGLDAKRFSWLEKFKLRRLCRYIDERDASGRSRIELLFSCVKKKRAAAAAERLRIREKAKSGRKMVE
ncbi:MAG: CCA tRNA nucleotidyltransferase [Anaerovoracaceae bacterium]